MYMKHVDIDLAPAAKRFLIPSDVFVLSASPSRMLAGVSGPVLLGIGSGISISAGYGSFGFSVLLDGLRLAYMAPLWFSQAIITLLFFWIGWGLARIPLSMGTLPALLLVGPTISLGATMTPSDLAFDIQMAVLLLGLFTFSLGISLSAAAALGPDGVTAVALAAEKRWRCPVPRANFMLNFIAICIGVALGGKLGIATFIGLFTTPVLISYLLPRLRKHMDFS